MSARRATAPARTLNTQRSQPALPAQRDGGDSSQFGWFEVRFDGDSKSGNAIRPIRNEDLSIPEPFRRRGVIPNSADEVQRLEHPLDEFAPSQFTTLSRSAQRKLALQMAREAGAQPASADSTPTRPGRAASPPPSLQQPPSMTLQPPLIQQPPQQSPPLSASASLSAQQQPDARQTTNNNNSNNNNSNSNSSNGNNSNSNHESAQTRTSTGPEQSTPQPTKSILKPSPAASGHATPVQHSRRASRTDLGLHPHRPNARGDDAAADRVLPRAAYEHLRSVDPAALDSETMQLLEASRQWYESDRASQRSGMAQSARHQQHQHQHHQQQHQQQFPPHAQYYSGSRAGSAVDLRAANTAAVGPPGDAMYDAHIDSSVHRGHSRRYSRSSRRLSGRSDSFVDLRDDSDDNNGGGGEKSENGRRRSIRLRRRSRSNIGTASGAGPSAKGSMTQLQAQALQQHGVHLFDPNNAGYVHSFSPVTRPAAAHIHQPPRRPEPLFPPRQQPQQQQQQQNQHQQAGVPLPRFAYDNPADQDGERAGGCACVIL